MDGVLMLTWFRHRRTSGICNELEIALEEVVTDRKGIARFAELTVRTIRLLRRLRPRVVIVQNPSLIGSLVTLITARRLGIRTVVDAHNEAVQPFVHHSRLVLKMSRWALRQADITIVTNAGLAEQVEKYGGRPFILPDPIPAVAKPAAGVPDSTEEDPSALVIATGAVDEPIVEVVGAARALPNVMFKITGRKDSVAAVIGSELPPNVVLTDFVDDTTYWNLLRTSTLVVDLTLMDDCLVCGAYEAIAVATPVVLSDNAASRQLFGEVARLVDNRSDDIAAGIAATLESLDEYQHRARSFLPAYVDQWQVAGRDLKERLAALAA